MNETMELDTVAVDPSIVPEQGNAEVVKRFDAEGNEVVAAPEGFVTDEGQVATEFVTV